MTITETTISKILTRAVLESMLDPCTNRKLQIATRQ